MAKEQGKISATIEQRIRKSSLRENLLFGFGHTNGIMGTPELLKEAHEKTYGCPIDETFAHHWGYMLVTKAREMNEGDAEILVQAAYDIFAAAEKACWTRSSLRSTPIQPVTGLESDLKFRRAEFIVLSGNTRFQPDFDVLEGKENAFECVLAAFPEYKKRLPSY